jgi:hypothetical protein
VFWFFDPVKDPRFRGISRSPGNNDETRLQTLIQTSSVDIDFAGTAPRDRAAST